MYIYKILISGIFLFATLHSSERVAEIVSATIQENPELTHSWEILLKEGVLEAHGSDKEVRSIFVTLQGIIEYVLASELQKSILSVNGLIHTPMPATPLCIKSEISMPTARASILRDYLFKGGNLYIAYPKQGFFKRTPEQQSIYRQELLNYPKHLFDAPLSCDSIPDELIGATYLFRDAEGIPYVFAIKMTQANDPREEGHFGLWFGPLSNPHIKHRVHAVLNYIFTAVR